MLKGEVNGKNGGGGKEMLGIKSSPTGYQRGEIPARKELRGRIMN